MVKEYKAVILLAGRGTRLLPTTLVTPKPLVVVGRYPLLWYSINNLKNIGITKFCLVVGHKANLINVFVNKYFPELDFTLIFNRKYKTTNSIYSYYLTKDFIKNSDYFRLDGDIIYSPSILKLLISKNKPIIACVDKKTRYKNGDYLVKVDTKEKTIIEYGKDIPSSESFGEAIAVELIDKKSSNLVVNSLATIIRKGNLNEYAEEAYEYIAKNGGKIHYAKMRQKDYWHEVDTKKDIISIQRKLKNKKTLRALSKRNKELIEHMEKGFISVFQNRVLKKSCQKKSYYKEAMRILNKAGLNENYGQTIEVKKGMPIIYRRSFLNIIEHCLSVSIVGSEIASIANFSKKETILFNLACILHDATKRIEILLTTCRIAKNISIKSGKVNKIAREILTKLKFINKDLGWSDVENAITNFDTDQFLGFINEKINRPFLTNSLSQETNLSKEDIRIVVEVASCDSFGSYPFIISSLCATIPTTLSKNPLIKELNQIKDKLKSAKTLPSPDKSSTINMLRPLLLYCDDIVQGNKIISINNRLEALANRDEYFQYNQNGLKKYGRTLFDTEKLVCHVTEFLLLTKIDSTSQKQITIPSLITYNLLNKVIKYIN